jgi:hypothetical protein
MRALTIRVSVDTVVGGFVQPNSRVDVINTVGGDQNSYSQTILQNMLVLAIDTINKRDPEKPAIISSNVTLAVTPEEAATLSLAAKMGELRLSLRAQDDVEKVTIRTLKPEDIRQGRINGGKGSASPDDEPGGKPLPFVVPDVGAATPAPEPPPEPVKPKKPWSLTLLNSDQQTKVLFPAEEDGGFSTLIERKDPVEAHPKKKSAAQPAPETEKPAGPAATPATEKEKDKDRPARKPAGT